MTKPAPGMPATISIEGKQYHLRFSLKALKELELNEGLRLLHDLRGLPELIGNPERLAMLLSYGLIDPETKQRMSRDWIDDSVDASMLLELAPQLIYAATGRWLEVPTEAQPLPNVPEPEQGETLTGSPSGQSEDMTLASVNGISGSSR